MYIHPFSFENIRTLSILRCRDAYLSDMLLAMRAADVLVIKNKWDRICMLFKPTNENLKK
jgi:hypothetical protein